MAIRRPTPKPGRTFVVGTTALVVAAFFAIPALAASSIHGPGDKSDEATLDVPVQALISNSEDRHSVTPADVAKREESSAETPPAAMETHLPGVSEDDQLRHKKHMYRRDI